MKNQRGFTLAELVFIIVVMAALFLIILGAYLHQVAIANEAARRASCMGDVRQIGLAMMQYAGDHDDRYPPLVDAAGRTVPAVDNAGVVSGLPARSAFAVLMKEGYITSIKVFICPSSHERCPEDFPTSLRGGALNTLVLPEDSCSYGWDPTKTHAADATCAIIADNPPADVFARGEGTEKNNSDNHRGAGQNAMYNDGHVKWGTTPRPDSGDDPDIYTGGPGYERSNTDAKIIR